MIAAAKRCSRAIPNGNSERKIAIRLRAPPPFELSWKKFISQRVSGRTQQGSPMQREFPAAPLVGAGAIIVEAGRVLLIRRGTQPMKGRWSIPGGLVELGESLTAAVQREAREETGLDVEPLELVELLDRIHREDGRVRYHFVIADYLCRLRSGTAVAGSDADAVRWATAEECLAGGPLDLDPITARIVQAGFERSRALPGLETSPEANDSEAETSEEEKPSREPRA
jgi:ADP-ribose pyrophosphatase YjhB (NUDIX family)